MDHDDCKGVARIMSLRDEQYHALLRTRDFLRALLPKPAKKITEIRKEASGCLHHFPFLHKNGQPMWSSDPFCKDYPRSLDRAADILAEVAENGLTGELKDAIKEWYGQTTRKDGEQ